jgi:hypothetical protein
VTFLRSAARSGFMARSVARHFERYCATAACSSGSSSPRAGTQRVDVLQVLEQLRGAAGRRLELLGGHARPDALQCDRVGQAAFQARRHALQRHPEPARQCQHLGQHHGGGAHQRLVEDLHLLAAADRADVGAAAGQGAAAQARPLARFPARRRT